MLKRLNITFWRVFVTLLAMGLGSALADPGSLTGSIGR